MLDRLGEERTDRYGTGGGETVRFRTGTDRQSREEGRQLMDRRRRQERQDMHILTPVWEGGSEQHRKSTNLQFRQVLDRRRQDSGSSWGVGCAVQTSTGHALTDREEVR